MCYIAQCLIGSWTQKAAELGRGARVWDFWTDCVSVNYLEPGVTGTLSEGCCQTEGKLWVVILDQARKVALFCNHVMA